MERNELKNRQQPQWFDRVKATIAAIFVFIIVLIIQLTIQQSELNIRKHEFNDAVNERVRQVSSLLSSAMKVRLSLSNSLTAFVKTNASFSVEEFDIYASALKQDLPGIRSLQLAPNGIVTYLTDINNNRAALGHDLLADPNRRVIAEKSIREKSYIIAGPIDLIQGGRAIIARRPIFLESDTYSEALFWGFATVLIDIDQLLEEVSISKLAQDYNVSIRGKDGLGESGDVFFGSQEVFDNPIATSIIDLPNASWQIAASLPSGFEMDGIFHSKWFDWFTIILSGLCAWVTFSVVDRPRHLQSRILAATAKLQDEVKQRKAAEKRIRYMAQHDLLTGLPNRLLFTELGQHMVVSASREKKTIALLFIDLDGFKWVNDTFGHKAGDLLLKQTATRLRKIVRQADAVARIGGDEFVILLSDVKDTSGVDKVAGLIVEALSEEYRLNEQIAQIGASVGIAMYPNDADDIGNLMHQADLAMYTVKNGNKSGYAYIGKTSD